MIPSFPLPTITLPSFELANPWALLLLLLIPAIVLIARSSQRGMRRERARAALYLRIGMVVLLALAAADPRVRSAADRLAVAFLVDLSDSIPGGARETALKFVRDAAESAPGGDEAAVIAFGGEALVERPTGPARTIPSIASNPPRTSTDLAAALRVGLGALPTDRARRLVVLSDGNENQGRARDEARVAAAAGVPVDYVTLAEDRGPEVLVRTVDAPGAIREGDTFALRLSIESTVETSTRVRLLTDGRLDESASTAQPVQLHPGTNSVVLAHDPLPPGFHTFKVQIEPGTDTIPENNEGTAFTTVSGRPRVLIVEGFRGGARFLIDALKAGGLETGMVPPTGMPTDVAGLRQWDGVVLVNTPATALSPAQMNALKTYVQTFGGGLTMVGGDKAFALGGYQRTPLEELSPLSMQRRGARAQSSVALVLVIDNSGSMGDNVGGMTKMDLAKEAALSALDLLTPADQLGVIAFEDKPRWAVDLETLTDAEGPRAKLRQMAPGGGTAIYPALEAAYDALSTREAKVKHIVLLTDGISPGGDYPGLTRRMQSAGITLSTIGIGNDADVSLLQQLADQGSGRYYEGSDPFQVPQILVKETLEVARTAIVEEPFRPGVVGSSPIMDGIDPRSLPVSRGYVSLTPKPASLVVLGTRQGDPLLAEWQYGLGQVVAWTSDGDNRWSADWVEWPEFSRFWSQAVKRTVPARVDQNLQTTVSVEGERARVTVESLGDDRSFRNFLRTTATLVAPSGAQRDLRLDQVGPGRYEAVAPLGPAGAYLLQVVQRGPANPGTDPNAGPVLASQSTGFVTTASTEYWQLRPNRQLLESLAGATGGKELRAPSEAFLHNLKAPGAGRELWPWLTAAAVLLFLVDVAVRRLRISTAALQRAWAVVRARLALERARPAIAGRGRLLGADGRLLRGGSSPSGEGQGEGGLARGSDRGGTAGGRLARAGATSGAAGAASGSTGRIGAATNRGGLAGADAAAPAARLLAAKERRATAPAAAASTLAARVAANRAERPTVAARPAASARSVTPSARPATSTTSPQAGAAPANRAATASRLLAAKQRARDTKS